MNWLTTEMVRVEFQALKMGFQKTVADILAAIPMSYTFCCQIVSFNSGENARIKA